MKTQLKYYPNQCGELVDAREGGHQRYVVKTVDAEGRPAEEFEVLARNSFAARIFVELELEANYEPGLKIKSCWARW